MTKMNSKGLSSKASLFDWEFIKTDEGESVSTIPFRFLSAQIDGEFNDDQTVHFEGSNDGVEYHEIKDINGNYIEVKQPELIELPVSYASIRPCFYCENELIESKITVKLLGKEV